jgi:hypothetical protein
MQRVEVQNFFRRHLIAITVVIEADGTATRVAFAADCLTGADVDIRVAAVVVVCDEYLASNVGRVWPTQSQDVAGEL